MKHVYIATLTDGYANFDVKVFANSELAKEYVKKKGYVHYENEQWYEEDDDIGPWSFRYYIEEMEVIEEL